MTWRSARLGSVGTAPDAPEARPRNTRPAPAFLIFQEDMTVTSIGKKIWAIAEGYIPSQSTSDAHDLVSHEAACILNASDDEAKVEITIYFADRECVGPYRVT